MEGDKRVMRDITTILIVALLLLFSSSTFGQNVELIGSYNTPGLSVDVFVNGDYCYAATTDSGLQIIDISDPINPIFAGSHSIPGSAKKVFVSGQYAFVGWLYGTDQGGIQIINVSNPSSPTLTGSFDTYGFVWGLIIQNSYAYIANPDSGLQIIDISDPSNPVATGSHGVSDFARDVFVNDSLAYVSWGTCGGLGDCWGGMEIFNVSDNHNPISIGQYFIYTASTKAVFVTADYAYICYHNLGYNGFEIVNVSTPSNPDMVGNYDSGFPSGIYVSGDYAYTNSYYGIQIVDVSDPAGPTFVADYDTPGVASGIFLNGEHIFVAAESSIMILQFNPQTELGEIEILPAQLSLAQNYPNPFNASTTISFVLPQASEVTISIYNLLGQQVATILEDGLPAGEHDVVWNAEDSPSGVYFARLETNDNSENIKMVLLK
jgi:hypothetical protein